MQAVYKVMAALAFAVALAGCDDASEYHEQPDDVRLARERTNIQIANEENAASLARTLANAKNALAVAKIEEQTNEIRAKTAANVNRTIESSVKNPAYLKNWSAETGSPGSFGTAWTCGQNMICGATSN